MSMQRDFLLFVAAATGAAMPVMAQTPLAAGSAGSETHSAASIPNFSRVWNHPAFPWFEPMFAQPHSWQRDLLHWGHSLAFSRTLKSCHWRRLVVTDTAP